MSKSTQTSLANFFGKSASSASSSKGNEEKVEKKKEETLSPVKSNKNREKAVKEVEAEEKFDSPGRKRLKRKVAEEKKEEDNLDDALASPPKPNSNSKSSSLTSSNIEENSVQAEKKTLPPSPSSEPPKKKEKKTETKAKPQEKEKKNAKRGKKQTEEKEEKVEEKNEKAEEKAESKVEDVMEVESKVEEEKKSPKKEKKKVEKKEEKNSKSPKKSTKSKEKNAKETEEKPSKSAENPVEKPVQSEEKSLKTEEKSTEKNVAKDFFGRPLDSSINPLKLNDDQAPTTMKKGGEHPALKKNYDPVADASWKKGENVPYMALAEIFQEIEKDRGRLRMIALLGNLFRSIIVLSPADLLYTLYLAINKLAPAYEGIELGIGDSTLMKAIAEATGRTMQSLKASYDELGDLGLVAQASRTNQKMMMAPAKLTIQSVYQKLKQIATMQGQASVGKKKDLIKSLLVSCRDKEAMYVIRSLTGKLRIGLAEKTILAALANAIVQSPPEHLKETAANSSNLEARSKKANEVLRSVQSELPNYDLLIPALLKYGIDELPNHCKLVAGTPVHPMLAQPTNGIGDALERFSESAFTCEYKYDGERAQIHKLEDGTIKIYSRNLENNTGKYPDLIENLPRAAKEGVTSYILDCEAVAYDRSNDKILPFQVLSTRARKSVKMEDIKVQVCLFAFDLLYLNGESLLHRNLLERRKLLLESFQPVGGEFKFATCRDSNDIEEIETFLNEAIEGNCEGLMIKTLEKDATYEPSKRSFNWLKVKKDYIEGLGDSLDLVVVGGYYGRGKRTGVYGGYLLACYDEDSETYQSITKIGTGLSDEQLSKTHAEMKPHIIDGPRSYYSWGEKVKPDVWFDPAVVWEIKAADLSISPVHQAAVGLCDPVKGVALRFPRFIRVREDKQPEEATGSAQVAEMYKRQKINHSAQAADEDDY
eukprot:TRINITY_DN575_c0_g1_i1.p1 TRINITY_DN575_c0_g1~~TRINITY_DN575_c0_g1_i1.p1  ORF type:complete len:935 (-),score=471.64 TRINITY_DN575_c0_g1_i1:93-2897(-)